MRKYETTFIIDSLVKNEEIEAIIGKIEKFISNNGGEIELIDRWGKKRLAYELKKRQYGYYVHITYQAPSKLNKLLEREYQLDENIIRHLTLLVDPRSLKAARQIKKDEAVQKNIPDDKKNDVKVEDTPAEDKELKADPAETVETPVEEVSVDPVEEASVEPVKEASVEPVEEGSVEVEETETPEKVEEN